MKKIDAYTFPYGKVTKRLIRACDWLNDTYKGVWPKEWEFDYPEYWEMPKSIAFKLSSDEVDFIQDRVYN